ncbi:hypothetical protein NDI45_28645 [Leptolyngbya sp. GB1-A1]|uniref:hypothetical protein n=1 Tax=Leptolyngbya sp. GB1-A1 TaxID=2933908 RepID=UPI00329932DB
MMIELWRDKEAALGIEHVPAIIIVDSEREVSRKRIYKAGFQTYLSKSFGLNEVVETVAG